MCVCVCVCVGGGGGEFHNMRKSKGKRSLQLCRNRLKKLQFEAENRFEASTGLQLMIFEIPVQTLCH